MEPSIRGAFRFWYPPCAVALLAASLGGGAGADPVKAGNLPAALRGSEGVNGAVFLDVNSNGWRDQGEPAIPELPILLDGLVRALTDSCGQYAFSGLSSGLHTIVIEPDQMPAVYHGAARVVQTIFAGRATRGSRFEVGLFPPRAAAAVVRAAPARTAAMREAAVSASELAESEKARAVSVIQMVSHQIERVRTSGYSVLVRETVIRTESALEQARTLLAAGDTAGALRLAVLSATAMDEARRRIETETQQPLRW